MNSFLKSIYAPRVLTVIAFITGFGGAWDIWWHRVYGRDTFWTAPHDVIYGGVVLGIIVAFFAWRATHENLWRNAFFMTVLAPLAGPLDNWWHATFGKETVSSPTIIWSPPHLMLAFSIAAVAFTAAILVRREENSLIRSLLLGANLAVVMRIASFIFSPFDPLGAFHLIGFVGNFFFAASLIALCFLARKWIPFSGGTMVFTLFFIALDSIGFDSIPGFGVPIPPHEYPFSWIRIASLLGTAFVVDLLYAKHSRIWVGAKAGVLLGILTYFFAIFFRNPAFSYTWVEALTAVAASGAAGVLAALIIPDSSKK